MGWTGEGTVKIDEKGVGISKNDRTKILVTSFKTEVSKKKEITVQKEISEKGKEQTTRCR